MSRTDLINGLHELDQGEKPDSAIARIREIAPHIEDMLAKGYTQKQVWQKLVDSGLAVSFGGFKSTVHRLREEIKTAERGSGELQSSSSGLRRCPHCGKSIEVAATATQHNQPRGDESVRSADAPNTAVSTNAAGSGNRMAQAFAGALSKQDRRRPRWC